MNTIRSFAWTWRVALFVSATLLARALPAQERARRAPLNYDEAKVPPYTLPRA